jgi:hypothetical protein
MQDYIKNQTLEMMVKKPRVAHTGIYIYIINETKKKECFYEHS